MKTYWCVLISLGLIPFLGKTAIAFGIMSPGQTPEQAMEIFRTRIVTDSNANTYYVRILDGLCTLNRTSYESGDSMYSVSGMVRSLESLAGSCVYPPPDPTLSNSLRSRFRSVVPVQATVRSVFEDRRLEELGYVEQLFEMFGTDSPDAARICAVSIHIKTPTGRSVFLENIFDTLEDTCNFETIIAPMD